VSANSLSSFERVFPTRELFHGRPLRAILWSIPSSFVLCLLLFDLFLLADFLQHRGQIEVSAEQVSELAELIGTGHETTESGNRGILPTVWWSRDKPWGPVVSALYGGTKLLRADGTALMLLVACAAGLAFLRMLLLSHIQTLSDLAAIDVATRLRRSIHRQTLRVGPGDMLGATTAHAVDLLTEETERVRNGIRVGVDRLSRCPLEIGLLVLISLTMNWLVAFECLVPLAACWYLLERQRQRVEAAKSLIEDGRRRELRLLAESLGNTRLIRGYTMEAFDDSQFQKHLERFSRTVTAVNRLERWSQWGTGLLMVITGAIVVFLAGIKVITAPQDLSLSAMLFLIAAFAAMGRPLELLRRLPGVRTEASLAADRVYRYLNQIPEVGQAVGAKFLQPLSRSLQFESVSYDLPDKHRVLDGLDLKITAGRSVAIVALDPLESRALVSLLPRFIEPASGRILIDGEDIGWVTLESLRAETAYVGGISSCYFTGTVLENISCGNRDYSLSKITEAAKQTHAHNFVLKLPQGYETVLGEHGEQLEAGQAFRLGLARALLRDPALLIVEEPTVMLDDDTKSLLDDTYNRIVQNRTVIFLPSRMSTARRADQVVLLHRGRVEAVGSHSDLVNTSALYRHWQYIHFNEYRHEEQVPV